MVAPGLYGARWLSYLLEECDDGRRPLGFAKNHSQARLLLDFGQWPVHHVRYLKVTQGVRYEGYAQAAGHHAGKRNELPGPLRNPWRQSACRANFGDLSVETDTFMDLHGHKRLFLEGTESYSFLPRQRVSRRDRQNDRLAIEHADADIQRQ
jgi:hypothetical protein